MKIIRRRPLALVACSTLLLAAACSDRDPMELDVGRAPMNPLVFDDAYAPDVYWQPFFQTDITAVAPDSVFAYNGLAEDGARSLKFHIAPAGSALGLYTGGVITSAGNRDLADFNALTFYARASEEISLDVAGFGNDNTGTSLYEAGRFGIPLTRDWVFVVIPIPAPSKLLAERGMLTFAESLEQQPPGSGNFPYPQGYDVWLDEIRYAYLQNIEVFRATMRSVNRQYFVGSTVGIENTSTVFLLNGALVPIPHSPAYFDYSSSNPSVAEVRDGSVRVVGAGDAVITAKLEDIDVTGQITLRGAQPPSEPAPTPTLPASDVISMFSDAYNDVPVASWRAPWGGSTTVLGEYVIGGSTAKMYASLNFVGITFEETPIDASQMTHFHLDVYAPAGTNFRVKLVSFPSSQPGSVETGDLILTSTTTPAFETGKWSSLDIPLTNFTLPASWDWSSVGQLVLSSTDAQLVLVDNVYWHK